jgi:membrane-bound lytic murein transglycosylase B
MNSFTSLRVQLLTVLGALLGIVALAAFTSQSSALAVRAAAQPKTCQAESKTRPVALAVPGQVENYDARAMAVAFWTEEKMSPADRMKRWEPLIAEASNQFGVPQSWLRAVMQLESAGHTMLNEKQPIKSTMGAMGLMQLMPETYAEMQRQLKLGNDPYDPHDNVFAAAAYLRWLHDRYGYPNMFAAYNDGPGNLEARLFDAGLLPRETQVYMSRITGVPVDQIQIGPARPPNLVKFTQVDGSPVYIDLNAGPSVSVEPAKPGEFPDGVRTVITVGKTRQGVWENPEMVQYRIKTHSETPPVATTMQTANPAQAQQQK